MNVGFWTLLQMCDSVDCNLLLICCWVSVRGIWRMIICRQLPVIQQTPSWFLPLFQPGNVVRYYWCCHCWLYVVLIIWQSFCGLTLHCAEYSVAAHWWLLSVAVRLMQTLSQQDTSFGRVWYMNLLLLCLAKKSFVNKKVSYSKQIARHCSRSNSLSIYRESQRTLWTLWPCPLGMGVWLTP